MTMTISGTSGLTMPGGQTQVGAITTATAVLSTSGTSIDFTGIPSWVKRVTVMFAGVSTNGTSKVLVQIGSGSFTTTGYLGSTANMANAGATTGSNFSAGFTIDDISNASGVRYGSVVLTNISGNVWVEAGTIGRTDSASASISGGGLTLSGTLDRVRITTVNGTDAFDAGSINILYE